MLRLFHNADFARLFLGRLVTNAGDSLYAVAAVWLVYTLGGSTLYTGLAGFLTTLLVALQFLAGPLVDRWPARGTLVATQVIQGLLVLVIPVAAALGRLTVPVVLIVMPLAALVGQMAFPTEMAALPRVVGPEHLVRANSAFSFAYQGAEMAFSALAGVLIAVIGAVALYVVDLGTFVVAAALFAMLRLRPAPRETAPTPREERGAWRRYGADLSAGLRVVRRSVLLKMVTASIVVNLMIGATLAVLPAFAAARGGAKAYGALTAALAAGSLLGALLAPLVERYALSRLMVTSTTISCLAWTGAGLAPWAAATVLLFGAAWVPIGATNVVFYAVVQRVVPARLLGRVSSVLISVSAVVLPLGYLVGGGAGARLGSGAVVIASGVSFAAVAAYWLLDPQLRRFPSVNTVDPAQYGLGSADSA